jgi:hypothetical protein
VQRFRVWTTFMRGAHASMHVRRWLFMRHAFLVQVAWNEVAVSEAAWSNESDREQILGEIRVLQALKHKNIMSLYDYVYDRRSASILFITELFTDGTLRQYRKRHKNVDIVGIKRWAWQILQVGLLSVLYAPHSLTSSLLLSGPCLSSWPRASNYSSGPEVGQYFCQWGSRRCQDRGPGLCDHEGSPECGDECHWNAGEVSERTEWLC